jgi:hypothetical protein
VSAVTIDHRNTTTAQIAVDEAAAQDPHELPGAKPPFEGPEGSTEKGATAPTYAGDVENVYLGCLFLSHWTRDERAACPATPFESRKTREG